jgi:WD40 repeat protein
MSIKDSGAPAGTPQQGPPAARATAETHNDVTGDGRFDAFISYRRLRLDIAFVDQLEQDLTARGLRVWVDREKIEAASDWEDRIARGINASKAFVFVITPEAVRSPECRRELDQAVELNKLIVPVVLREVPDRKELPASLTRPNWVMFTPGSDLGHAVDQLSDALTEDLSWRDEHARYTIRSGEWARGDHDKSFLLRGSDLRVAEEWLAQAPAHPKTPPTAAQTAYIVASRKAAVRTQRTWQGALSAGLVIAIVLAVVAFLQRDQAQHNAQVANSRAQAEQAIAGLSSNPEQSVAQALSATQTNASPQTEQALRLAIADDRLRMTIRSSTGADTAAAWNPARGQIAVSATHGDVALWNSATGRVTQLLPTGSNLPVIQLVYDASGSRLAAVTKASTVAVWDISAVGVATAVPTADLNNTIRGEITTSNYGPGSDSMQAIWAGADGVDLYVFGNELSNVAVLDLASGTVGPLFSSSGDDGVSYIVPSPNGSALLTNGQIVDFTPGPGLTVARQLQLSPLTGAGSPIGPSCWFPDGSAVITSPDDAASWPMPIYSAVTGKAKADMEQLPYQVEAMACSAGTGDEWVAAGDSRGDVLLRLADGTTVPLSGHSASISSIASSPDGRYLATASADGTARVWDAATGTLVSTLGGNGSPGLLGVQFAPDSRLVLTVDEQGVVRVWDAGIGEPAAELAAPAHGAAVALGFTDADGQVSGIDVDTSTGAIAGVTALTWSARTGQLERSLPLPGITTTVMPCSAALQALGPPISRSGSCHVPPPPRLAQAIPVPSASGYIQLVAVAVSPDGREVAYARAHSVAVLDSAGQQVASLPVTGSPAGVAFGPGPDGLLVMTTTDIYLWHPLTGQRPLEVRQPSAPIDAAVSADGSVLAAADTGGAVGVWNAVTGKAIRTFRPADNHSSSYFSPLPLRVAVNADGSVVASGNADGTVFLWNTASGKRIAMQRVSTWPILELSQAPSGSALLAVDWLQPNSAGPRPGTGEVLAFATGRVIASYASPTPADPATPIDPGAGLSPDGSFVYAGSLGLAPTPPGGSLTVYQVSGGQPMTGLPAFLASGAAGYSEFPADPWSPDGTLLLAGNGVYRCDACQPLQGLQITAKSRIAWATPLSVDSDHPPATDPYA